MLNRKLAAVIMSALMVLALTSCSNDASKETVQPINDTVVSEASQSTLISEEEGNGEDDSYYYVYNNVTLKTNTNVEDVIKPINEEYEYFETNSCAYLGKDKVYTYVNFIISTYPQDGADFISSIEITSDAIPTVEGICVGDSMGKVKSIYGDNFVDSGTSLTYIKGESAISFIDDNGVVSSILYTYPDVEQ